MGTLKDFTELEVWIVSKKLTNTVYKITERFPQKEDYRLTDQMCRAAVSIPSNIAEGIGRNTSPDKKRFLYIARGSAFELETQAHIAYDLNYLNDERFKKIKSEILSVKKLLNGFISYLK